MAAKRTNPVAQGGMWNTSKVSYSQGTQNLLKEMMKESKLTNFQQRQLTQAMKEGDTLPTKVHPTSSAKPRQPVQVRPQSKVLNARNYTPQTRSKDQIENVPGVYERDQFAPKPQTKYGGFYEKDKKRLANIMAYGEDVTPPDWKKSIQRKEPKDLTPTDRFDELQKEIDERQNFLEEMESLGQGEKYRPIISTEISQLIREMELIDKKRSAELEKAILEDDKRKRKEREKNKKPAP